ncbi:translocation/assembly module TamB domain-containing protein [Bartonella sp. DGB2]|uniref:translocation/assembly module TamB domain-containing protein n=1 Tax=Bartonella sp. DGB2 TaxID=3388426 RepID=UPI0039902A5B
MMPWLAYAQAASLTDDDRSWMIGLIERQISAPNRQIRLQHIEGTLSAKAKIGEITVSDQEGVWLKIEKVKVDWNRAALLKGRLDINQLSADKIDFIRLPLPNPTKPEAEPFSLPALPIAVLIKHIKADQVNLGESLFGLTARLRLDGHVLFDGGGIDSALEMERLDDAGSFSMEAHFSNAQRSVRLMLKGDEPDDGILANILKLKEHPALHLELVGAGTYDDLQTDLLVNTKQERVLDGHLTLRKRESGHSVVGYLSGPIFMLVPEAYHEFLGSQTRLNIDALWQNDGGVELKTLKVETSQVKLQARARLLPDGFLRMLVLDAVLEGEDSDQKLSSVTDGRVTLPIAGGQMSARSIHMHMNYGEGDRPNWEGKVLIDNFSNGDFKAERIDFDLGGLIKDLDDTARRHVGIDITGTMQAVQSVGQKRDAVIPQDLEFVLHGRVGGAAPLTFDHVALLGRGFSLNLQGTVKDWRFNGGMTLDGQNLLPLSIITGTPLTGKAKGVIEGAFSLLSSEFNVHLSGKAEDLYWERDGFLARLLAGKITVDGGLARDKAGMHAQKLSLKSTNIGIFANGSVASKAANFDFFFNVPVLSYLDKRMAGSAKMKGTLRGHDGFLVLSTTFDSEGLAVMQKPIKALKAQLQVNIDNSKATVTHWDGTFSGDGHMAGAPLHFFSQIKQGDIGWAVDNLFVSLAGAKIEGAIQQDKKGLWHGGIQLNASDISNLAALSLARGEGDAVVRLNLNPYADQQNLSVEAMVNNFSYGTFSSKNIKFKASATDLMKAPAFSGYAKGQNLDLNGVSVDEADFTMLPIQEGTRFMANAHRGRLNMNFGGETFFKKDKSGFLSQFHFNTLQISDGNQKLFLDGTASLTAGQGGFFLSPLVLKAGSGRLHLSGSYGDADDDRLVINVQAFPLSLVNMWEPKWHARGQTTGDVFIEGGKLRFSLAGAGWHSDFGKFKALPSLTVELQGAQKDDVMAVETRLTEESKQSGYVHFKGGASLAQKGNLYGVLDLHNLSLGFVNAFVNNQALIGRANGTVNLSGQFDDLAVDFSLKADDVNMQALRAARVGVLSLETEGNYRAGIVEFTRFEARFPQDMYLKGTGRVNTAGQEINLQATGRLPLGLANAFTEERGTQFGGLLNFQAKFSGNFTAPLLEGNFHIKDGRLFDPQSNIRLKAIGLNGTWLADKIAISGRADSGAGGRLFLSGDIAPRFAEGLPADLKIRFDGLGYEDGRYIQAFLNGDLHVTGQLLHEPLVAGHVKLENANIILGDFLAAAPVLDIDHKHLTRPIAMTLDRANMSPDQVKTGQNAPTFSPRLDINIHAPHQIFVRGRGLDVEMGGNIHLVGSLANLKPTGDFELIRGRFDFFSQRLNFTEGRVSLTGNLNPRLYLTARNNDTDFIIDITISGAVDNLSIKLASEPSLPQDEILARLVFKRPLSQLSPLQVGQLVLAARQLAGGGGGSVLDQLREKIGLDDLDVITDAQGYSGVRVGRYLRENIYLGVEAGTGGTEGTVNLDINKNLKAKGVLGSDGNSSLGLFYEKDY